MSALASLAVVADASKRCKPVTDWRMSFLCVGTQRIIGNIQRFKVLWYWLLAFFVGAAFLFVPAHLHWM